MYKLRASMHCAPVVELVDAVDSKSTVREDVLVRVRPGVPYYFLSIKSIRCETGQTRTACK